jgi:hypothetical protein
MVSGVDLIFQAYPKDVAGMIMEYYVTANKNKTRRLFPKVHKQLLVACKRFTTTMRKRVIVGYTTLPKQYEIVDEYGEVIEYYIDNESYPIYEEIITSKKKEPIRDFIKRIDRIQRQIKEGKIINTFGVYDL